MKLNKKKVFTLALAVCLIAILSLGSLAWFTAEDSVTNNFYVAGSEDQDPDDVFSVDVWENDEDGTRHDDGIEYPDILPGDELVKEVYIENTGAYDQYIRATVTVTGASIWQEVYGEYIVPLDVLTDADLSGVHTLVAYYDAANDAFVYELYYEDILTPGDTINVFDHVYIPENLDREQAAALQEFQIIVVADAVQTENVGDNVYEAFKTVGMLTEVPCDVLATPETIDAVLASAEEGTVIGLAAGEYDTITLTQNNLTIVGTADSVVGMVNLNAKDNCRVMGVTFDAAKAQMTYTFATGNKQTATNYLANITGDTDSPKAADNATIMGCTFTGVAAGENYVPVYFNEQGAATERCDSITIENCVFACDATQYIALNYMSDGTAVIKNNTFGSDTYGTSHNTIQATGNAASWTITGNSFNNWNVEKTAIGSSKQGSNTVTWTVTGNEFNHVDGAVVLALKTSYNADNTVVNFADNTVLGGNGIIVTTDVNAENEEVYAGHAIKLNDGVAIVSSSEEMTAALQADKENIVVFLTGDVTYDVRSIGLDYAMGGADTKTITINGNGYTITFNGLASENNYINTNGAKLIINDASITATSTKNSTVWNVYDAIFACDVELNNVTSDKPLALKADAVLNNVTVNNANDVYAIWIQPNGQTVTIDGLTVNAGRGIKIDEQYVNAPAKVTLNVSNATFDTAEKAAIMVNSAAGADITLNNVDISNTDDTTNAVWVDADAAAYYDLVTVTGGSKVQE